MGSDYRILSFLCTRLFIMKWHCSYSPLQCRVLKLFQCFPVLVCCCCCCKVASVVSDSVWPHRQQPTSLPCPWNSPGKNTGVGCHFLLQCMKVKSESEVAQSCLTLRDPIDGSPPGSPIPGILQARTLVWVAGLIKSRKNFSFFLPFLSSWLGF